MSSNNLPTICLQRQLSDLITRKALLDEIRILLAQGAKVNLPVTQGLRPLHYAVYENYPECVELLIIRGADLNTTDEIGYTPLHLAAERGYLDILKILVKAGAKVKFSEDRSLLSLDEEPLRLAIKGGHYDCTKFLLQNGADANVVYFLGSELSLAASLPGNGKFIELLLRYGAKTESRDRNGLTPIMRLAKQPNGYEATKLLLKYGAEVNCYAPEDQDYRSVLHYAVLSSNLSTLRLLLFCGANVAYPSEMLKKPSSLDFAILKGDLKMVELLIEFGAQLNTGSPVIGLPLHIVLSEKIKNRKEILIRLLENGADPNLITVDNRGPLLKPALGEYFNSSEEPEIDLVRLLLKYNARVICTAQIQHPLGILKCLNKIKFTNNFQNLNQTRQQSDNEQSDDELDFNEKQKKIFDLLMNACELFSIEAIQRCRLLNSSQKYYILNYAKNPLKLKNLARLAIRRYIFKFAQIFFDDEQNASSASYTDAIQMWKNSNLINRKNFDLTSSRNEVYEELMDFNDPLNNLRKKNVYKKYIGNRYQRCINSIENKLFIKKNSSLNAKSNSCKNEVDFSSDETYFNKDFAVSCGLTTEELEIVKLRREQENKVLKNRFNQGASNLNLNVYNEINEINSDSSITTVKDQQNYVENYGSTRNVACLPIGFRYPPGCEWPIRLIELNCKYNDYNCKYYHSSKETELDLVLDLKKSFSFDETRFRCSSSFANYIIEKLFIPDCLRRFILYEED